MKVLTVSRHPAAIKYAADEVARLFWGEVEVVESEHVDGSEDVDAVIGVLPIPIISKFQERGVDCYVISLPQVAFGDRGKELSPVEMRAAGARIEKVRVEIKKPARMFVARWKPSRVEHPEIARGAKTRTDTFWEPDPECLPEGYEFRQLDEEALDNAPELFEDVVPVRARDRWEGFGWYIVKSFANETNAPSCPNCGQEVDDGTAMRMCLGGACPHCGKSNK